MFLTNLTEWYLKVCFKTFQDDLGGYTNEKKNIINITRINNISNSFICL